jgi:hypothetical protein
MCEIVLVLGCGRSEVLKNRLNKAIDVYTKLEEAVIIVSGRGRGVKPEAEVMKMYLLENLPEIEPWRILCENQSMNTIENIIYSDQLLRYFTNKGISIISFSESPDECETYFIAPKKIHIVSSAFHIERVSKIADIYLHLNNVQYHGVETQIHDEPYIKNEGKIMKTIDAQLDYYERIESRY